MDAASGAKEADHLQADAVDLPEAAGHHVGYVIVTGGNKGIGRLTRVDDQSGRTEWVYDGRGNVTTEKRVISGKAYTTAYVYNAADLVTQVTYPSGRIVLIARNALGQISGITTKKDAVAVVANVATSAWAKAPRQLDGLFHDTLNDIGA